MSRYNLILNRYELQTVKDLDLSQGDVFHSLTYERKEEIFS